MTRGLRESGGISWSGKGGRKEKAFERKAGRTALLYDGRMICRISFEIPRRTQGI